MERTNYAAEFKSEAVKQVIGKGQAVVDVARGLALPRVFFTAVSTSSRSRMHHSQVTSRPGKQRDSRASLNSGRPLCSATSSKKPQRNLPSGPGEVRVHAGSSK